MTDETATSYLEGLISAKNAYPGLKQAQAHVRRSTKAPIAVRGVPALRIRPTYRSTPIRVSASLRRMDHRFQLITLNADSKAPIDGVNLFVRFEYSEMDELQSCVITCEPILPPVDDSELAAQPESAMAEPGTMPVGAGSNKPKFGASAAVVSTLDTVFTDQLLFGYFNEHVIAYNANPWKWLRAALRFESTAETGEFLHAVLRWSLSPEVPEPPYSRLVDSVERPYDRHAAFLAAIDSFEIAAGATTTGRVLLGRDVCVLVIGYLGEWDVPNPAEFDGEREHARRLMPVLRDELPAPGRRLPRLQAIFLSRVEVVQLSGSTRVDHRFLLHHLPSPLAFRGEAASDATSTDAWFVRNYSHHPMAPTVVSPDGVTKANNDPNGVEIVASFQFRHIYARAVLDEFTLSVSTHYPPTCAREGIANDAARAGSYIVLRYADGRFQLHGTYGWKHLKNGLGLDSATCDVDAVVSALFYWVSIPYGTEMMEYPRRGMAGLEAASGGGHQYMFDATGGVSELPPTDYSVPPPESMPRAGTPPIRPATPTTPTASSGTAAAGI